MTKILEPTYVCDGERCPNRKSSETYPERWIVVEVGVLQDGERSTESRDACSRGCAERIAARLVRDLLKE